MKLKTLNRDTLKRKNHIITELQYAVLKMEAARIEQLRAELARLEEEESPNAKRKQEPPGDLRIVAWANTIDSNS